MSNLEITKAMEIKVEVVNLTPHVINMHTPSGEQALQPSGVIPRCVEVKEAAGAINGVPVVRKKFGEVQNMPAPKTGTIYVVSAILASALKGQREDVVVPDDMLRDEAGRIIGCRGFAML